MCLGLSVSVALIFLKQPPFKDFGNFMAKTQKIESIPLIRQNNLVRKK
jgi:hypothetical protein